MITGHPITHKNIGLLCTHTLAYYTAGWVSLKGARIYTRLTETCIFHAMLRKYGNLGYASSASGFFCKRAYIPRAFFFHVYVCGFLSCSLPTCTAASAGDELSGRENQSGSGRTLREFCRGCYMLLGKLWFHFFSFFFEDLLWERSARHLCIRSSVEVYDEL